MIQHIQHDPQKNGPKPSLTLDLSALGVTLGASTAADGAWQVLGRDGKVTVLIDVTGDALADMGIDVAFGDGLAPALLSATDFIL